VLWRLVLECNAEDDAGDRGMLCAAIGTELEAPLPGRGRTCPPLLLPPPPREERCEPPPNRPASCDRGEAEEAAAGAPCRPPNPGGLAPTRDGSKGIACVFPPAAVGGAGLYYVASIAPPLLAGTTAQETVAHGGDHAAAKIEKNGTSAE